MMKIFMTGGTGFIGQNLARRLLREGWEITILTRSVIGAEKDSKAEERISYVQGNALQPGSWQKVVPGHIVILNLAGSSIFARWTEDYKKKIWESRIETTRRLVEALPFSQAKDEVLLNASAVGYYGFRGEEELTELSPAGSDFLATLCQEWEREAMKAKDKGWRVVLMRFGLVLGKGGGLLNQLIPLYKKFLGGRLGRGKQWFSWIHLEDLLEAIVFLIKNGQIEGPVNLCSPFPVEQKEFARALGRVLKRPSFLPLPAPILRLALGELATVILNGQKVRPAKLLAEGFTFRYPQIEDALAQIVKSLNLS